MHLRALSQAKGIALSLRLYAGDHDGRYPVSSVVASDGSYAGLLDGEATDANASLRPLVPDYVPGEKLFWVAGSPWTPRLPDELVGPGRTLADGENHWAYVPGLTLEDPDDYPLLADGFAVGRPGVYDKQSLRRKGWKGGRAERAIVVRNNQSAALVRMVQTGEFWIVLRAPAPAPPENLFSVSANGGQWIPRDPVNPLPPPTSR